MVFQLFIFQRFTFIFFPGNGKYLRKKFTSLNKIFS